MQMTEPDPVGFSIRLGQLAFDRYPVTRVP